MPYGGIVGAPGSGRSKGGVFRLPGRRYRSPDVPFVPVLRSGLYGRLCMEPQAVRPPFHSVVLRLLSRQDDVPVVLYRDGNGDAAHREGFVVDVTRFARFAP